ncbi:type II secretion system F family protein [Desulfobacula sp.]|uniref:type II secretion system F family protein n=1 Tax=Desulfobacula sp. TaxID=2593537 RepID=UPI00260189DF|nr:type II secretion system F family protein [Desulfobacula sp.]
MAIAIQKKIAPVKSKQRHSRVSVKPKEIIFFLTQLSMMLEVGISVSKSIETIAHQTPHAGFKSVLLTMKDTIEDGQQLSDAMAAHPGIFKPVYVNIIRSGESGGFLVRVLANVIEIQEKNQGVFDQVKTALIYPMVLCCLALVVTLFVLVGILPKFMVFFENKIDLLPFSTRAMMALSRGLHEYWWAGILVLVGGGVALHRYLSSSTGRSHMDWLLIHLPIVSKISHNIYTGLFLRILGNMLDSGVSLKEALSIAAKSMTNQHYKAFVDKISDNIERGQNFSLGFSANRHIQDSVKQVIAIGEEVGKLPLVMVRLARFYEQEIEQDFKRLTSLIEPLALVFMGGAVWMIVSAVILPMFRLAGAVK